MRPDSQGSTTPTSGRTTLIKGVRTFMSTFVAILLPNIWFISMGMVQSSLCIMDGRSPCALHVSERVALRTLLPIQGGCLRE